MSEQRFAQLLASLPSPFWCRLDWYTPRWAGPIGRKGSRLETDESSVYFIPSKPNAKSVGLGGDEVRAIRNESRSSREP